MSVRPYTVSLVSIPSKQNKEKRVLRVKSRRRTDDTLYRQVKSLTNVTLSWPGTKINTGPRITKVGKNIYSFDSESLWFIKPLPLVPKPVSNLEFKKDKWSTCWNPFNKLIDGTKSIEIFPLQRRRRLVYIPYQRMIMTLPIDSTTDTSKDVSRTVYHVQPIPQLID